MANATDVYYVSEENTKKMKNVKFGWLIFAFVMIFNPNIQLIDVLPDFIGFFILAKFISRAADAAPYFEEARSNFIKLAYISLAKIPALIIITLVRSKNLHDNDIIALFALVFATVELLYLIPAIKNFFDALLYLGERGNVPSLIKSDSLISTDALRSFTYAFVVFKAILCTVPEFLKLTRSVDIGSLSSVSSSRYYPWAILMSLLIGFAIGGIWLVRVIRFSVKVRREGRFYSTLAEIATVNSYEEYEKKVYARFVNLTFLFFILSAIFSVDLTFSDYNDINLLPSFISGIFFSLGLIRLIECVKNKKLMITAISASVLYNTSAIIKWGYEIAYLDKFSYADLFRHYSKTANAEYLKIQIASVFEFVFYIALTVVFYLAMKSYTQKKLGKWHEDTNPEVKKRYYKEINVKTVVLTVITLFVGLVSFVNVFVQGNVKILFTNATDVTMPALFVPTLPWFGLVITVASIIYSFYSVYYFNFIKDEERA
ncbi:MAG: hypothetical protein E7673_00980 [Ruminococcaceae bacterium]|nr:hypothetical protein [Oscillospiraceae bacterium]